MTVIVSISVLVHTFGAFITDLRERRIPNQWNLWAGATGIGFHLFTSGWRGLGHSITGLALLLLITAILYALGAIGGGDVKWFAALGAWTGWQFSFIAFVYTLFVAAFIACILFISQGSLFAVLRRWGMSIYCALLLKNPSHIRAASQRPMKEIPLMLAALPAVVWMLWQNKGGFE